MNEVIREFLLETHENLAQLDLDLVQLEKDPGGTETIARVFRTLHTVKGTAGFLGLPKLQAVAHAAENLLTRLRSGEMAYTPVIASGLLAAVDAVRKMLDSLEKTETEGDDDFGAAIATLEALLASGNAEPAPVLVESIPVPKCVTTVLPTEPAAPVPPVAISTPPSVQPSAPVPAVTPAIVPIPAVAVEAMPVPVVAERTRSPNSQSIVSSEVTEPRATAVSDSALRVDVGLLDKLMTLVGELVLARNQIMQFSTTQEESAFLGTVQRLNLLTTELQASVMKTRMQPIGNMWSKFPRVVRDLAVACGKQVHLEMDGKETELDKTIVEAIRDPLTHLVRNAVDHGIETPAQRIAQGKPAEGRLALQASHEGGKIIIKIVDDGRGIDPHRVREKAIANKLITPEQAERMSEREITELIFLPGFSTADKVTNFSGRGVGMDVVRTNVEKIGGTVDIHTKPGHGTTLKMKIPLTLAIIPALTITSGGDRYAIPQVSLLELVRLEGEQAQKGIEWIQNAAVYRLRGNLLPLVYLNRVLQVEETRVDGEVNIVVLQADDRQFGLIVDAIHDTEEIVVKPLQKQTQGVTVFSGATIMGDGKVALILDVLGIAQKANVVLSIRERGMADKAAVADTVPKETVLLFSTRSGERMAVPLASVARLEEFPRSALERVGKRYVVQYRGQILPLLDVGKALGRKKKKTPSASRQKSSLPVQVVVYIGQDHLVGLIVGQILDIVEEAIVTKSRARRQGVLYSAVIQEKVTEFLDVEGLVQAVGPDFFDSTPVDVYS
ncbi:MAG: chemotaxis protein CheW [Planctomycetota bacterium]